jgi:hypothetical protein
MYPRTIPINTPAIPPNSPIRPPSKGPEIILSHRGRRRKTFLTVLGRQNYQGKDEQNQGADGKNDYSIGKSQSNYRPDSQVVKAAPVKMYKAGEYCGQNSQHGNSQISGPFVGTETPPNDNYQDGYGE